MDIVLKDYSLLTKDENINLLKIRNDDDIRKNMLNQDKILLDEHIKWLTLLEQSQKDIYYAVFVDKSLCGGINITRINTAQSTASWGVFFKQGGNPLVPSIVSYLFIDKIFNSMGIKTLNLEVDILNTNAYKFDINFGFKMYDKMVKDDNTYYLMSMDKSYWNNHKTQGLLKNIAKRVKKINYQFIEKIQINKNKKILLAPHSPMSIALKEYLVSSGYEVVGFIDKNKNDTNIYKIDKLDEVSFDIVLILSPNHFKAIYKEYLKYLPKEIIYQVTIQDYKYGFTNEVTIEENKFIKPKNLQIENKFAIISNDFISSNNKFFYIHCIKQHIPAVILTNNQEQIQQLQKYHLPYKVLDTQEGYEEILSAKYIVLDQGNYNDLPPLDKNQKIIQLWHGVGLKKMSKLTNITYDYFISTSTWTNETNFKNIFLAKEFLNCGYPRNDIFNKEYENRYSELFCDKSILNFVKNTNSKIALYMPTHRATKVELPLDFEKLNSQLKDINFTMIVKLHPLVLEYYSNIEQQKFSNILFHNTQGDIYPILNFVDVLISDYSSIVYDFLLLDRPIIFFNYDFDTYLKTVKLLFDYDKYSPGIKVKTQEELCEALIMEDRYKQERKAIKNKFFDIIDCNSSERILKWLI